MSISASIKAGTSVITIMRTALSRLKRLVGHRVSKGVIIPPETRVDPVCFPEEEFLVFCPRCDYRLQGLPECRCPECGRPFDRGRLLVEQYVIEQGARHSGAAKRWAKKAFVAGTVLVCAGIFLPLVVLEIVSRASLSSKLLIAEPMGWVPLVILALGFICMLVSTILRARVLMISGVKCRRVRKAIDRSDPVFRSAQRIKHIPFRAIGLIFASFVLAKLIWDRRMGRGGHRSGFPDRFELVLAMSMIACIALAVVVRRYRPRDRDHDELPQQKG